jgi:cobalamin biosynthesis Mg chelatase CobN
VPSATPSPGVAPAAPSGPRPLPKATVKLQQTGPLQKASPTTTLRSPAATTGAASSYEDDYSEEADEESGLMPFSIIVLVLSVVVLVIEVLTKMAGGA